MQPLDIHPRLLREAGGAGLTLTPGRGVMARVVTAEAGGRGVLNIAGVMIEARLPPEVRAGESLRLVVRALEEHRVVLALASEGEKPGAPPAPPGDGVTDPPPPIPLPGGARLRLHEKPEEEASRTRAGGAPAGATLALRYEAPALGVLDLRFALDAGTLRLEIAAGAGDGFSLTRAHAGALREALEQALGRTTSVTVVPRREPLDIYA